MYCTLHIICSNLFKGQYNFYLFNEVGTLEKFAQAQLVRASGPPGGHAEHREEPRSVLICTIYLVL